MITVQAIQKKYYKIEIDLLLAHVLKKPREFLYLHPTYRLTPAQAQNLTPMIKRRLEGEPIAYILGYKYFMGLRFKVNRYVLIPRPETEWLVERAFSIISDLIGSANRRIPKRARNDSGRASKKTSKIKNLRKKLKILDVGTGSGCIIISLVKQLHNAMSAEQCEFYASDISAGALSVARRNAANLLKRISHTPAYGRIEFVRSDLFRNLKETDKFDVILANLPYVSAGDYRRLRENLKYEPKLALTDGTNRWRLYREFFKQVPLHSNPGTIILLEIDPKAKTALSTFIRLSLLPSQLKFYKDCHNLWRYLQVNL